MSKAEDDYIQSLTEPPREPDRPPLTMPGADVAAIRQQILDAIESLEFAGRSTRIYRDKARYDRSVIGLSAALGKIDRAKPAALASSLIETAIGGQ